MTKRTTTWSRKAAGWLAMALCAAGAAPVAQATVFSFDDLATSGFKNRLGRLPGPLTFDNFYYLNAADFDAMYGTSGYSLGLGNVGYSGFGQAAGFSSTGTFTFNGAYLNTAWNAVQEVFVTGSIRGAQVYATTLRLNSTVPLYYDFGWVDVDSVAFTVGRAVDADYLLDGNQIVFDDIAVNEPLTGLPPGPSVQVASLTAVPEPGTWALLIGGLGLVGAALRRRAGLARTA